MFAFQEEYPISDMASIAVADLAVPFYQPIIGRDHQVKGYEVLARRWEPAQQSYQGIDFASLSEEQSLHLDIVMLRAIMRDLPTLAQAGPYFLSINLNPTLNSPTYQNLLLLVLMQARKLGIEVWFEVLEQAPLLRQHRALIEVLRSHGAHIACDDFGTLECNFQRMLALPYEVIKLDRSLLLQASKTLHALRMLTGLVEYLQRLGMKVVCEGVETLQHIEIANRLGCDYQQGYAYAMPSPLSRWA
ncbi:EAL domain-containing protein [Aeromonas hydrophila]|uniref:EAL domain-containing protein n=1 Tax=Aeromonas hydrophila TaxID=644 RepID=UPI001A24A30F|nr:EAL domain-containing protein [Aeromonas hydrophila]MCP3289342.1 EAL domain-containing protein [Aeromonas hydrophila]HAU4892835.1 EAL domain-containing protein [Aeromonas hydrophila]HAU4973831.1 EAL domain-containing protein [Aeromonas hydrophila]HAU4983277.1 EAL domain-containing protein [Aeromonas hydrophila]HDX8384013.1 EAL domain-containing protein [Aeromonas hydrophila]